MPGVNSNAAVAPIPVAPVLLLKLTGRSKSAVSAVSHCLLLRLLDGGLHDTDTSAAHANAAKQLQLARGLDPQDIQPPCASILKAPSVSPRPTSWTCNHLVSS